MYTLLSIILVMLPRTISLSLTTSTSLLHPHSIAVGSLGKGGSFMPNLSSFSAFLHPHHQSLRQIGHLTRLVKNQKQSDKHVTCTFHVISWQARLTSLHKPSQPLNHRCKCVVSVPSVSSVPSVPYFFAKTDTFSHFPPFSHAEQKSHNFQCCSSVLAAFLRFSTEACRILELFWEFCQKIADSSFHLSHSSEHERLRPVPEGYDGL
jgi:hypothetical protein